MEAKRSVFDHFADVADPRVEGRTEHRLLSIIAIVICAVIGGAETWNEIEEFGHAKRAWLETFLALPNGIPTHDTFNRVFAALDPEEFRRGFASWVAGVAQVLPGEVIAIDGKTVRGSRGIRATEQGKKAIHMVSAWATQQRLVLAQTTVAEKSNEITAIPELLDMLMLAGCIVTIDAMGCQRAIAQKITDQGATYVLALKDNQGTLHEDVAETFQLAEEDGWTAVEHEHHQTEEQGHGREETRRHTVITDRAVLAWLQEHHHWPALQAIGMVVSSRTLKDRLSIECRHYVLNEPLSAAVFGAAVRSHWGVENEAHWVLDVAFSEDASTIREGYAAENLATTRHLALNLLRQAPERGLSVIGRRRKAGWDTRYLTRVLGVA